MFWVALLAFWNSFSDLKNWRIEVISPPKCGSVDMGDELAYSCCCEVIENCKSLGILYQSSKFRGKSSSNCINPIFTDDIKSFCFPIAKISKIKRSKINNNCHLSIRCSRTKCIQKWMLYDSENTTSKFCSRELQSITRLTVFNKIRTIQTENVVQNPSSYTTNKHNSLVTNHLIRANIKYWINCGFEL